MAVHEIAGEPDPAVDDKRLLAFAAGFGVRRSASKAGFSANALYIRRMIDPDFVAQ